MSNNKLVKNASWIVFGKIIQSLIGLGISMLTARYLGPSNFGIINYAAATVAFVSPILRLGIDSILVREIVEAKDSEDKIVGTAIYLNLASSIICMAGVIAFAVVMNPGDPETIIVCALYSIQLIFKCFELLQFWFQAKLLSKYPTIASLIAYTCVSVYKLYLLATAKSVYWFALSYTLDYLIIGVILYVMYRRLSGNSMTFSSSTAKRLLSVGKYYVISNMMITIFAQTDKIMLKNIINAEATAFYSTAVVCAGLTSFVFSAILDSFRPIIFEGKKVSKEKYERGLIKLFSIIIYLSLAQSIMMTVFAKYIVLILYGKSYLPAVSALRIVVWYTTFSYLGSARSIWILSEGKQKYLAPINFMGATLNIVLNMILIGRYGADGAAIASLVTQIFTNIVTGMLIPAIRPVNGLMIEALNPKEIINVANVFLKTVKTRIRGSHEK